MSTKNLNQLKIFALSNETTKACWQLGSLSKSYKHFQLIFEIFYYFACRCKEIFKYTCGRLGVSR